MPIVFSGDHGDSILVDGECYVFNQRTLADITNVPADIDGTFIDCDTCFAAGSSSSSSSSSSSDSSSSSSSSDSSSSNSSSSDSSSSNSSSSDSSSSNSSSSNSSSSNSSSSSSDSSSSDSSSSDSSSSASSSSSSNSSSSYSSSSLSSSSTSPVFNWSANGSTLSPYNDTLTAYWKLDEASGERLDQFGLYNLAATGAVPSVTGKIGNAADFDGSNQSLQNAAFPRPTSSIAISMWFNVQVDESGVGHSGVFGYPSAEMYYIRHSADTPTSRDQFLLRQSDGTAISVMTAVRTPIDTWTHIVCIADGTNAYLYRNNVLEGTTPYDGTLKNTAGSFGLSVVPSLPSYYDLNGWIDETSIWNEITFADDAARIAFVDALYNNGNGVTCTKTT